MLSFYKNHFFFVRNLPESISWSYIDSIDNFVPKSHLINLSRVVGIDVVNLNSILKEEKEVAVKGLQIWNFRIHENHNNHSNRNSSTFHFMMKTQYLINNWNLAQRGILHGKTQLIIKPANGSGIRIAGGENE